MRLDKILSENTHYSRSEIKGLIRKGQASVNGQIVLKAETQVSFGEKIVFCGQEVNTDEFIYIKMNKPSGVLTATRDKRETVVDLLPQELNIKNLFPVGRLDKDTTGLLILTNDGDLAHNLLSPKHHVEKSYEVELDGEVTENLITEFNNGVRLHDGTMLKPAGLKIIDKYKCVVTLTEGKYHQIKRMFGVYGLGVNKLKRISFGGIILENSLKEGEAKLLTNNELKLLKNAKDSRF